MKLEQENARLRAGNEEANMLLTSSSQMVNLMKAKLATLQEHLETHAAE